MRKVSFVLVIALFLMSAAQAQTVSGVVKDPQGKGLEKSTVSLLQAKDSSVVKFAVTGDDGKFSLISGERSERTILTRVGYLPGC